MAGLFPGSGIGASLDQDASGLCGPQVRQAAPGDRSKRGALALAQSQHRQRRGDYAGAHRQIGLRHLLSGIHCHNNCGPMPRLHAQQALAWMDENRLNRRSFIARGVTRMKANSRMSLSQALKRKAALESPVRRKMGNCWLHACAGSSHTELSPLVLEVIGDGCFAASGRYAVRRSFMKQTDFASAAPGVHIAEPILEQAPKSRRLKVNACAKDMRRWHIILRRCVREVGWPASRLVEGDGILSTTPTAH